jgi:hypothetical protein
MPHDRLVIGGWTSGPVRLGATPLPHHGAWCGWSGVGIAGIREETMQSIPYWRGGRWVAVATALGILVLATACQAEQRPGSVKTIGGSPSGSVSASVSGAPEAKPAAPSAAQPTSGPTKGDGVYTPVSNVALYQLIALDVAEIARLTNAVNEGKPLPSQEILAIYEQAKHAKVGQNARPLRKFAADPARAKDFPEDAAFFKSETFLDDPVIAAINGSGPAARYTPAQRRQAIQKGLLRILHYYTLYELNGAEAKLKAGNVDPATGAPHNVDEAWAIYVGVEQDGKYPYALAATALSREQNFKREGTIDKPLREALERAKKAALNKDLEGFQQAKRDVQARLNALFYLAAARYLNESLKAAKDGRAEQAATAQAEGFAFYQTIQPVVATVDAAADRAIVEHYQAEPSKLTAESRDRALAGLNKAAEALGLKASERLAPADFS